MAEKITSTLDPRIAADVASRARVVTQMQELLDKPEGEFGAEDLAALKQMQAEADGLSERIEVKQTAAATAADRDFGNALLEETHGMAQAGDIKVPARDERPPSADELIYQNLSQGGMTPVPMATRLRGRMVHDLDALFAATPTMRELRQMWMGLPSGDTGLQQDVIGRIAGTNVANISVGTSDITPQGVEARFVEVLRNINGPHKAGCEIWFTPSLEPIKLPKAIPNAGREPGGSAGVPAERTPEADIRDDDNPTFGFVNTQVREFSALFPVDRSADRATPAMIGAKVGELLARNLGAQVSRNATVGTTATTAEGVMVDSAVANAGALQSYLAGATVTNAPSGGQPTYATIMSVMGAKLDFPTGTMGDVWMAHKQYVFTALIGMRGTDGHPIFKSMGVGDTAPVDTLMGRPIVYTDYAPAANTNNRLMAVYGDFYNGSVCRRGGDIELATDMGGTFFSKNQVAYRGILYEAFVTKNGNQYSYLRGTT